jgi:Domain of unknown function (DUF4188)
MLRTALRSPLHLSPTRSSSTPPSRPPNRTHARGDGIVVFHIGMTIHRPLRPDLWMPVLAAMPRMLAELHRTKAAHERGEAEDLGFLDAETLLGPKGPWVVQYWRGIDQLYAYARMGSKAHLPAWRAFNIAARSAPGAVGIWHETFAVPESGIETFYGNGADLGLAKAVGSVPTTSRSRTARQRLDSVAGDADPA